MKLKSLIVRFFLLNSLFIVGSTSASYHIRTKTAIERSPLPDHLVKLWLALLVRIDNWMMGLGKAVYNAIDTIIGNILQIIALIISNMISGSYYKLHGTHNDDGELWQKFKKKVQGLLTK